MPQDTVHSSYHAAHSIWVIDEIVRNILAYLPSTRCKGTLASCARVSFAFSEPALDLLWCRMSSLAPLLRLLPHSFTEVRSEDGHATNFVLHNANAIKDDDEWHRLSDYARRVRKFHYHYIEGPAGEHAFSALVRCATLRGTTLFPNLQELSWLQFSHAVQCLPFLSSSLRRVTVYVQTALQTGADAHRLHGRSASDDYSGLLHLLDDRSPCVEEMSLEGIDFPHLFESPVVFRQLRTLHLGSVSTPPSAIISHCSKMPRLSSLSLVLRGSSNWGDRDRPDAHRESLSALEVLRIAGTPSEIEDVLDAIDSPAFCTIVLAVTVPDYDTDGWARCASRLASRFSASLRTVRAEVTRSRVLVPNQARPFALYVQPLLPLRYLRDCSVVVEDPAGIVMTDGDVETMAASWPCLTSLEVSFRGPQQAVTLPFMNSLAAFARCCEDLVSLQLPLSQDVSPLVTWIAPEGPVLPRRPPSILRNLWITGVRYTKADSALISSFLRCCFPDVNLQSMMNAGILHLE